MIWLTEWIDTLVLVNEAVYTYPHNLFIDKKFKNQIVMDIHSSISEDECRLV